MKCDTCPSDAVHMVGESNERLACAKCAEASDPYGFLSSDGYPDEGPNPLIKSTRGAYDGNTIRAIIHDFAVVRGDLSEQYARDQLVQIIQDRLALVYSQGQHEERIRHLVWDLNRLAREIYSAVGVQRFMAAPNTYVDGQRPSDVIRNRDVVNLERLCDWLESCADGNFA